MYDAIIVGGSFAGLATAMQLRGYRVLLIDQYPIGARQMSACGTPLAIARAVGAECAIQAMHDALVLHTAGQEIRFPLRDPYVTFDYQAFCQAMLAQTDAEVWVARAIGIAGGAITTTRGTVRAHFVVDATGWRSLYGPRLRPPAAARQSGYGVETELPVRPDISSGLHFYFEKGIVRNGYAWIFPCGATTRFGIGAFTKDSQLQLRLMHFLERFGLRPGVTHGGVLAIVWRDPVADDIFVVGDAAGQCLPASGEGIRTAIFHGIHCGRAIAAALCGELPVAAARTLYREQVCGTHRFQSQLLELQELVAHTPEPLLAAAGYVCSQPALTHRILRKYLVDSGWFLGFGVPGGM